MSADRYILPLFRRYPELEKGIPRIALGIYPTPVERLTRLGHGNLWIKREDLSSLRYGGNKVRKLEFIMADAKRRGAGEIVTMGGIGTNHGLATAIFCRETGLKARLLLFYQPLSQYVRRNMLLFHKYGASMKYYPGVLRTGAALMLLERLLHPRAYILVAGGSSPLGTVGIVNAMLELKDQVDEGLLPEPKYLFCPLGSNGTMAGLSLGALLAGMATTVVGVRVTMDAVGPVPVATAKTVAGLMTRTLKLLRKHSPRVPDVAIPPQLVLDGYVGDGYGCATAECMEALELMKLREGIVLDPTYTAKTFAALCDFYALPEHAGEPILYWHTYNSIDLDAEAATVDCRDLPPVLRRLYEKEDGINLP